MTSQKQIDANRLSAQKSTGRPTKLTPKLRATIFFLARRGCTDEQIAEVVGVARATLNNWKGQVEFLDALKDAKEEADDLVERSLFERALGYTYQTEELARHKNGNDEVVIVTHRMPPDVTACIFWLKNRRREQWRDRSVLEHSRGPTLEELVSRSMELDERYQSEKRERQRPTDASEE